MSKQNKVTRNMPVVDITAVTKATPRRVRAQRKLHTSPRIDGLPGRPNDVSWHKAFLNALALSPNVGAAATTAGIAAQTAYEHRKKFSDFAEGWQEALERGTDNLIGAAYDRAVNGVEKPVYQQGKLVGYVREYSDTLAIFLLRAHRPSIYGDKTRVEHSGTITQTTEPTVEIGRRLEEHLLSTMRAEVRREKPVLHLSGPESSSEPVVPTAKSLDSMQ